MAGASDMGIVPTRAQVIATRAAVPASELGRTAWSGNEGFEYWFPRPVKEAEEEKPLVILGGGRESSGPGFEVDVADDGSVNPVVGATLRRFLPAVFPGKFEEGVEPEMEWTGIMGFTTTGEPFVGPVRDPAASNGGNFKGQYIAAGYSGHGMPRGYACAEAVARLMLHDLAGRAEEWEAPEWLPAHYLTWNRG